MEYTRPFDDDMDFRGNKPVDDDYDGEAPDDVRNKEHENQNVHQEIVEPQEAQEKVEEKQEISTDTKNDDSDENLDSEEVVV